MDSVYDLFPKIDAMRTARSFPDIAEPEFWEIFEGCKRYTMLGVDALYHIFKSVEYVCRNRISGDFVECGVFLGGSVMAAAESLRHFGDTSRTIHLFDTFEGFPSDTVDRDAMGNTVYFYGHPPFLSQVQRNLGRARYPADRIRMVAGPVERTLLDTPLPAQIAFLRLDTDYYGSTKVELEQLYPRVVPGGVCTIDDYGTFRGARRATDEYLQTLERYPCLARVNSGVRTFLKP
jgi:O-methyltransferase